MNEINNLSYSEMLHLMLDGELDSSYETTLFNELSHNEVLRQEMRQMLAIRESVKKDFEAFTPPASVTKSLFSKLGYTAPVIVNTAANSGFWSAISQKLWHPLTTAIFASLVTSLFFIYFYSNNSTGNNEELALNRVNSTPVVINFESKGVSETLADDLKSRFKGPEGGSDKVIQVTKNEPIEEVSYSQSDYVGESEGKSAESLDFIDLISMSGPVLMRFNDLSKQTTEKIFVTDNNYLKGRDNNYSLFLQLKSMSGTSFPYVSIDNQKNELLSNFTISAFTPLSENWQLGLEAGQESFSMSFWDIDDVDKYLYKIEQNPSLIWAGLGVKYKWNEYIEFLANSQHFVHLTIASTSVGPLFKASTGIQFVSDKGFGIIFGIDGGSLLYQNESKLYMSNKLGISYGMFMQF